MRKSVNLGSHGFSIQCDMQLFNKNHFIYCICVCVLYVFMWHVCHGTHGEVRRQLLFLSYYVGHGVVRFGRQVALPAAKSSHLPDVYFLN